MGKHHSEYVYGKGAVDGETTLTKLRKLFHLPARAKEDREPSHGVDDNELTKQWIRNIHESSLPDYRDAQDGYENWEYVVSRDRVDIASGWYGITPSTPGSEDNVAAGILADWFDYNSIERMARSGYQIAVRRPGASVWQGFAEGRE